MLPLYVCHACKYSNTVVLGSFNMDNTGGKNLHPCLVTPLILQSAVLFNMILFFLFLNKNKTLK